MINHSLPGFDPFLRGFVHPFNLTDRTCFAPRMRDSFPAAKAMSSADCSHKAHVDNVLGGYFMTSRPQVPQLLSTRNFFTHVRPVHLKGKTLCPGTLELSKNYEEKVAEKFASAAPFGPDTANINVLATPAAKVQPRDSLMS